MPIIQPQVITPLPTPPNPADRSTFNSRAYPWSLALEPWTTQANRLAADTLQNATWAQTKASESQSSATGSANSATAANNAKTAAETAKTAAETARNGAQSSATAAANSATAANTAKTGAETARNSAAASATAAAQSAAEAAQSASGAIAPSIHAATAKTTPADADELPIVDSAASWSLKKLSWGNLKAAVFAAFKVIATGGSAKATLGLGTAATRDVGESSGNVMEVGAFGLGSQVLSTVSASDLNGKGLVSVRVDPSDPVNTTGSAVAAIHAGLSENFGGGVMVAVQVNPSAHIYSVRSGVVSALAELLHTGNILTATGQSTEYPMTQKAVTDAINAAEQYENIQRNAAATGTVSINLASASEFDLTLTGNTTIVFGGSVVPAGKSRSFVVRIRQGATARTLTWPASVTWLVVGPITTPAANKICEYVFSYSAESGWFGRIGASN